MPDSISHIGGSKRQKEEAALMDCSSGQMSTVQLSWKSHGYFSCLGIMQSIETL